MENIKTYTDLTDEADLQQSFTKLSQSGVFQESEEFKNLKKSDDRLPWVTEGVAFPYGTELRGKYKGFLYLGKVNNGAFILNGKKFLSPCAAAVTITRNPVDGWLFWDCKIPGRSAWVSIYEFKSA